MHSGGPQKAHRMLNTSLPRSPYAPLRCLLVSPEFPKNSFWNWSSVCKVRGEKTMGLPLGLLTLAAILPQEWQFQLVDQNTGELRDDDIRRADVVCVGGMTVQQGGILDVIRKVRQYGKFVAVGGTDPTSQPAIYQDADALVLGEAETNVPIWLKAWEQGRPRGVFQGGGAGHHRFARPPLRSGPAQGLPVREHPVFPRLSLPLRVLLGHGAFRRRAPHENARASLPGAGRPVRSRLPGMGGLCRRQFHRQQEERAAVAAGAGRLVQTAKHPFFFSTEVSLNLAEEPELMDQMRRPISVICSRESSRRKKRCCTRRRSRSTPSIPSGTHPPHP